MIKKMYIFRTILGSIIPVTPTTLYGQYGSPTDEGEGLPDPDMAIYGQYVPYVGHTQAMYGPYINCTQAMYSLQYKPHQDRCAP